MSDISPINRIYLTYKARIIAESKLRLFSKLANALIIWYSFWMIIASIAEATNVIEIAYFEVFFAGASIAIFASSIYLSTGIMQKRADEFRACYLEFQKIYNSSVTNDEKMKRYNSALPRYPNHTSMDHADVIYSTWHHGGELYDTQSKIPFEFTVLLSVAIRKITFWGLISILFVGPLWYAPSFVSVTTSG